MSPFWRPFWIQMFGPVLAFSSKLGPNVRWKRSLTANAAQPCWSRAQGLWNLSNTPSPHRGAGGLKTLRDTAAPLVF